MYRRPPPYARFLPSFPRTYPPPLPSLPPFRGGVVAKLYIGGVHNNAAKSCRNSCHSPHPTRSTMHDEGSKEEEGCGLGNGRKKWSKLAAIELPPCRRGGGEGVVRTRRRVVNRRSEVPLAWLLSTPPPLSSSYSLFYPPAAAGKL